MDSSTQAVKAEVKEESSQVKQEALEQALIAPALIQVVKLQLTAEDLKRKVEVKAEAPPAPVPIAEEEEPKEEEEPAPLGAPQIAAIA